MTGQKIPTRADIEEIVDCYLQLREAAMDAVVFHTGGIPKMTTRVRRAPDEWVTMRDRLDALRRELGIPE